MPSLVEEALMHASSARAHYGQSVQWHAGRIGAAVGDALAQVEGVRRERSRRQAQIRDRHAGVSEQRTATVNEIEVVVAGADADQWATEYAKHWATSMSSRVAKRAAEAATSAAVVETDESGKKKGKGKKKPRKGKQVQEPEPEAPTEPTASETNAAIKAEQLVNWSPPSGAVAELRRAIASALPLDDAATVADATMSLVECYGVLDADETAKFLAWHVVATLRVDMQLLSERSMETQHEERLLLQRRRYLESRVPIETPAWQVLQQHLQSTSLAFRSSAWHPDAPAMDEKADDAAQRWDAAYAAGVKAQCDELGATVVTLWYSNERHAIYGSIVERIGSRVGKLVLTPIAEQYLVSLLSQYEAAKAMLQRRTTLYGSEADRAELDEVASEFERVCSAMNDLLSPLFERMCVADFADRKIVLIADATLFALPLEHLSVFASSASVVRDFSFSMRCRRVSRQDLGVETPACVVDPANDGQAEDEDKSLSAWFDRFVKESVAAAVATTGGAASSKKAKKSKKQKDGGDSKSDDHDGMTVVHGHDHSPAPGEWQQMLSSSSTFVFVGFGPLMVALGAPSNVAALDMSRLRTLLAIDNVCNERSSRRLAKLDKQPLASPYHTALLFSLRGAGCVVLNTHAVSVSVARHMVRVLWPSSSSATTAGVGEQVHRVWRSATNLLSDDDLSELRSFDRMNTIVVG
eukprot:TRINITY_DN59581_c0_g1_i1.p1 TRINITY_DN59581_c0_g1~~TRINITY_DN59581_c0_g1_i1.p1  ORF type:complete len:786 (-),score=382.87 TRINITY_DN59581_c0_g1_i1:19-2106(-)